MGYLIGEINGPESATESRLKKRALKQLEVLERKISQHRQGPQMPKTEAIISDLMGELSYNVRRVVELTKAQGWAKGRAVGHSNGHMASLWDFLGAFHHLIGFLSIRKNIDDAPELLYLVAHSDQRSIVIEPDKLFGACRALLLFPPKRHFTILDGSLFSGDVGGAERPAIDVAIVSRRSAKVFQEFYWTEFRQFFSREFDELGGQQKRDFFLSTSPNLKDDPIFVEVFGLADAVLAKR